MNEPSAPPADEPASTPAPGLGASPSGPTFQPWQDRPAAAGAGAEVRVPATGGHTGGHVEPDRVSSGPPPPSRAPALLTAAVVGLLGLVVLVSSLVAYRADRQPNAPAPAPPVRTAAPTSSSDDSSIEFTAADGSGRLVVRSHTWVTSGIRPPESGRYLRVQVELICTEGTVSYDPQLFQVFDATGRLYDQAAYADSAGALSVGTLGPDERVRGSVSFDVPRGGVTLLMTENGTRAVTALKIPD